ncbi:hypothetical protein Q5P01_002866 [Channa striata]|uniref:C-type lectin domain-containing protein n=1 Tax=Channa striata TaxID=64152 RepID=A0AA88P1N2_CHASR|nr:hypothetical protein Q5P01_002866 [Channa striata]
MKILTVFVLGFAVMALARAADFEEENTENDQTENNDLVKRYMVCKRGWTRIYGRCYRYVPNYLTWHRAKHNCRHMGGHLASVRNIYEYRAIQKLILRLTHVYKEAWLGGSDLRHESVWRWTNGKHFGFTYWCRGEPNNGLGRQHCLQMNYSGQKCWDDLECYAHRPSVCVKSRHWGG